MFLRLAVALEPGVAQRLARADALVGCKGQQALQQIHAYRVQDGYPGAHAAFSQCC